MCTANSSKALTLIRNETGKNCIYIEAMTYLVKMLHCSKAGQGYINGHRRVRRRACCAGRWQRASSAAPLYWFYEMSHAALNPSRAWADATRLFFKNPVNPLSFTTFGKSVAAACELFERSTRRYGRPEWRIDSTLVGGERVPVQISTVWERPFCKLMHFERVVRTPAEASAAAASDRRADVGPLRNAVARHRRGVSAQPRRLCHRLGRRAHGAAVGGAASISTITSTTSFRSCTRSAATPTWSPCASRRCRCSPRPR